MSLVSRLISLVSAIGADIKTLTVSIAGKVDAVAGKGLSTEDFTTALKDKLSFLDTWFSSAGGENLFYNSAMRRSLVSGAAHGWMQDAPSTVGSSTGVLSLVASFMSSDENAQRLTVTGLTTTDLYRSLATTPIFNPYVPEGHDAVASAYVKGTSGLSVSVIIQAINSAGTVIATLTATPVTLTGKVQRVSAKYATLPAGTVRVRSLFRIFANTVTDGTVDFARPKLELGALTGWCEDLRFLTNKLGNEDVTQVSTAVTGSWILDCGLYTIFDLTLAGNTTISFANVPIPANGKTYTVYVKVRMGSTVYTYAHPANVTIINSTGTTPTPVAGKRCDYIYETKDGVNWDLYPGAAT